LAAALGEDRTPLDPYPLDGNLACEVAGLRLWEPPEAETVEALPALWVEHPVLVFRRQALSEGELADFSAHFGPLKRIVRRE
jgi:alpha-ketoglutarate-dependent taurine dioxygenase